jgi:hypothetical protein
MAGISRHECEPAFIGSGNGLSPQCTSCLLRSRSRARTVSRHWGQGIEPPPFSIKLWLGSRFFLAHKTDTADLAIRITKPHPIDDVLVLEHFEPPVWHCRTSLERLPFQKIHGV